MKSKLSALQQNMIYALILLVIGIFFYLVRPVYQYEPQGIFLPSVPQSPPALSSTHFSFLDELPLTFTPVGKVTVSAHFESTDPAEIDAIVTAEKNFIQSVSIAHGANAGIISEETSGRSPGEPNVLDGVILNATAIQVN